MSRLSERCGWHTRGVSTQRNGARSLLATIVGYVIVAIVVLFVFNFIVGTILWLFRTIAAVVIVLALVSIYLTLKAPD